MKKSFLISALILFCVLFISHIAFAQRYYRDGVMDEYVYGLNLTEKQLEKIDKLEIQLEKELTPFLSELRKLCLKLDELEMMRSPSQEEIDNLLEKIYSVEDEIVDKEIQYDNEIRGLLTEEQKAVFDSYYGYGRGLGRGYLRPGLGRLGCGLGPYRFRGGQGWGQGRMGRGYYGYGRYQNRFYPRYGYGRGLGRGRLGRFYNYRYHRRRFLR